MSEAGTETRNRLLNTAVEMLDELQEKDVSAAEILRRTGIARGSLYHAVRYRALCFFSHLNILL